MTVSWRDILLGAAATLAFTGAALAGGPTKKDPPKCHSCDHGHGPKITPPNIHIGAPKVKIGGTHVKVHHGGVLVNKTRVNVNVSANASASASASAGAGGDVYVGGGGYFAPAAAPSLGVVDICIDEDVLVTKTRLVEKLVSVRAACIDDRGAPHPAARLNPEARIETGYEGELYRCPAGSYLQVTLGDAEGGFNGGSTIECGKGEALVHAAHGELVCRAQTQQRDCFERSLLRKYGPGEKLLMIKVRETYEETQTKACPVNAGAFTLSGGVGAY